MAANDQGMPRSLALASVLALAGCGSETESAGPASPAAAAAAASCEASGTCATAVREDALGTGDGSASSVTFTEIYTAPQRGTQLIDLAFNLDRPTELWTIGYGDNRVYIGSDVLDSPGTWKEYLDPAARHFMHKPPAFAWGANGFWGICGDNDNSQNDARGDGDAKFFTGPALFTSNLEVFAKQTPTGLGSHYDMLHNTSFCRGIAHVEDNWFWVFNGELGSLDRYNFAKDHGPGNDDHSDGEIYRYVEGQVKGVTGLSSHVFFDASDRFLYVADTGNGRVVRLDTSTGTLGARLPRRNEPLAKSGAMGDAVLELVVATGVLQQPSGLEVRGGKVYVSDAANSTFHAFDKDGVELRRLETGLPAGSLSGFTFGKDGKVWFVDRVRNKVLRIDP